jgi:curved DNA-binding protein CbpA
VPPTSRDPYRVLGVSPGVSDRELQAAYRRLVQLHHPDHNQGSAESAARFEEIQEAYARVRALRAEEPPNEVIADPDVEARLADLEHELREAQERRERARRAAAEAAARAAPERPSDEELGYVTTDDSFSKILADARSELAERFADTRDEPAGQRVADLLEELAARLRRRGPGS